MNLSERCTESEPPRRWLFGAVCRHIVNSVRALGGPRRAARAAALRLREQGPGVFVAWAGQLLTRRANYCARNDYGEWIRRYDTLSDVTRRSVAGQIASWNNAPLVSVIMPVFDPPERFLREALDSLLGQLYPGWELCAVDDASTNPRIRQIFSEYSNRDPRIRFRRRETNGGIAAASNEALSMARGEWVALLDHDDLLAEHALFALVAEIRAHPEARLVYSDEDKVNENNLRYGPYFKPDWNLTLFRSHNLVTHLAAYEAALLRETGGFREGYEGAQDYDLALSCVERLKPENIRHIPRVLYHWRSHAASTADASSEAKPHAMRNGRKALQDHFNRLSISADVELIGHGYHVRYRLPDPAPMVSAIIPTRDSPQLIRRCVLSLLEKTGYPSFEILLVDNGTTNAEALDFLREMEGRGSVRVIRVEGEFNFASLNNEGVRAAKGEIVALLNNDLEVVDPGWLEEMVSIACQSDVGAVGALLLYPDGRVQHGGIILGTGGWAGHAHKGLPGKSRGYAGRLSLASEFCAVTGACLVVRKKLYEDAGGLDSDNLSVACNDVDFCLRLRGLGYRNVWTPFARLFHAESASRGYEDTPEKIARFEREKAVMRERWGGELSADPCYSPNLSLETEDFSLAWPPRVAPLDAAAR